MPKTIAESAAFIRASIDQLHRPLADNASEAEAHILMAERNDVREARVVIEDLARHARWSNDETLRLALLEQLLPIWLAIPLAIYTAIANYDRTQRLAVIILTWWYGGWSA